MYINLSDDSFVCFFFIFHSICKINNMIESNLLLLLYDVFESTALKIYFGYLKERSYYN